MLGKVGSSRRVYISECVDKGIPFYRGQEISRLSYRQEPNPELFITLDHYESLKRNRGVPKTRTLESYESGHRKALLVMATGERVIIVMGAVFTIKSRVSGALNKYISCIA